MEATTATTAFTTQEQVQQQLQHTVACLPIVYGSIAFYLGKKADEYQTHEWSLFLRGPNHEDLSPAISRVIFQLHPSFAQPVRELTEPPYEVTERGWGEFEAQIRVHWKDPDERTTIVNHTIKLYPPGTPPNALPKDTDTITPVIAETYDEVVFTDPSESFFKSLRQVPVLPKLEPDKSDKNDNDDQDDGEETTTTNKKTKSGDVQQPETRHPKKWKDQYFNKVYSDQQDFLTLLAAQKFLQEELSKVKQRFQIVNDDTIAVDQKMILAQQQKHREAAAAAAGAGAGVAVSSTAATTANAKSATATTKTTKTTTTGGKKTKTPSGQRKQRPSSQTKKAKTAITPVPTSSSSSAAVPPTATATARTPPPPSVAAATTTTKTTTTAAAAAAAGTKGQPSATTSTKPAGPGKTVVTTKK
jgi:YEATS domain-containing protein 4